MDRTLEFKALEPLTEVYSRYLPELIIEKILAAESVEARATVEQFSCAVMFADISGFTPLTEKLAAEGEDGTERLTDALNAYFTPLITLVKEAGGDVVKFAGDALIAIWRERPGADDLKTAAWRAARCGLQIQQDLKDYSIEGLPLTLRVAIGAGKVAIAHLGGQLNRWEFIISGRPLEQVGEVSDCIQPGDVGISPEVSEFLGECDEAAPLTHALEDGTTLLDELATLPEQCRMPPPRVTHHHEEALKKYLPGAIVHRIREGLADYLGEIRSLTILFVNLPDLTYSAKVEQAQAVMEALQKACYRYEGSINKLSVDDKGVSLLAAFGLPPLFHVDDPDRGVKAALTMQDMLTELGWRSSVGITTGRVYCGAVGSQFRREYTIMGDSVNLAARLMQSADGGVLCDTATQTRASAEVRFEAPVALNLKGKAEAVSAHRPLGIETRLAGSETRHRLIGREEELATLESALDQVRQGGSATVILEGTAGMGKSATLDEFLDRARARSDCTVLWGSADAIEKSTSYFTWQPIVRRCFELGDEHHKSEQRAQAKKLLSADGNDALAPLLDDLVALDFEDNDLTRQMTGVVRASNIRKIIADRLTRMARKQPIILALDDAHWMDSASWTTVLEVARRVSPVLLVVAMRPLRTEVPEFELLKQHGDCHPIRLDTMTPEAIGDLVADKLGVDGLPPEVLELIEERSSGHPYVAEEIGYALRDGGSLLIEDGQARLSQEVGSDIELPDTIQGMITARIDRLSPNQAMTVKVASVIGRSFRLAALAGVYPNPRSISALLDDLDALESLEIVPGEGEPESDRSYHFKHLITQKVAYRLMLADQRRQLHERVARWIEKKFEDLEIHYPLLAHHWGRAGVHEKALDYLDRAARKSLEVYANAEAAELLQQCLEITKVHRVDRRRRGEWLRRLATAQRDMTRLDDSLDNIDRAVALLDAPAPRSRIGFVLGILYQAFKQWKLSRFPPRPGRMDETQKAHRIEAAEAYDVAMIIYYWRSDKARLFYSVLRAANLSAETGDQPRVLLRAYSNLGIITGVVGLHKVADHYCVLAERLAREADHPPTLAWVLLPVATYRTGQGQLELAERQYDEALEISVRIGDERHWSSLTASKMVAILVQGRLFECLVSYRVLYRSGARRDDRQAIIWALAGQARVHLRQGDYSAMVSKIVECEEYIGDCTIVNQIDIHSIQALAALAEDRIDDARERLLRCHELLIRPSQVTFYPACSQVGFLTQEMARRLPDDEAVNKAREAGLTIIRQFAKVFAIGEPTRHVFEGIDAWRQGDVEAARGHWQNAYARGDQLGMPYEMALTCRAAADAGVTLSQGSPDTLLEGLLERMEIRELGFPYGANSSADSS